MRSKLANLGLSAVAALTLSVAALPEAMADDSVAQIHATMRTVQSDAAANMQADAKAALRQNAVQLRYAYRPAVDKTTVVAAREPALDVNFTNSDLLLKLIQATPKEALYRVLPALAAVNEVAEH